MGVFSITIGAILVFFILSFIYKNSKNTIAEIIPYFLAHYVFIYGIYGHIHFRKFTFIKRRPALIISTIILFLVYFIKVQTSFDFLIGRTFLVSSLMTLIPFLSMAALYFRTKQAT